MALPRGAQQLPDVAGPGIAAHGKAVAGGSLQGVELDEFFFVVVPKSKIRSIGFRFYL